MKRIRLWFIPLILSLLCLALVWNWKSGREAEVEKHEAYYMARQGFRAMHPDSDLPLSPQNLNWKEESKNQVVLEADGTRVIATARVPNRWIVHLRHNGTDWQVVKAEWKQPDWVLEQQRNKD